MNKSIEEVAKKYALINAVKHGGKAVSKAVFKGVFSEVRGRVELKEVGKIVGDAVKFVNSLSLEKQKKMLEDMGVSLEREKKKEELPEIPRAEKGKVVTRFAPSPTGPVSLGQFLRAVWLSYYYARRYEGKFILRIEDTDARKIKKEYYDFIKEDLKNSGIEWDELVLQSERLEMYYKYARELIKKGKAYVCRCSAEKFRELKLKKIGCECREREVDENVEDFEKMVKGEIKEGEAVIRFKSSMKDPNPVLRDPPLMRVVDEEHPIKGNRYHLWPLYNFSCAIDDHLLGVTHVFRGKEHEHNTAVQKLIYDFFTWEMPVVINFGMIRLPGAALHTRDIKRMIERGEVSGWDDVRLPTLRAIYRRGITPEALKKFSMTCGLSKTDINASWENIYGINRKVIDPIANRYMVVINAVRIRVKGSPSVKFVYEALHPDFKDRGRKKMPVNLDEIYVSREDFERLRGRVIRLKGLFNVELDEISRFAGNELVANMKKIQWVSSPNINVEVLMPDGDLVKGLGENEMRKLNVGDIIQMERFGFGRVDEKNSKTITICFAHK